MKTNAAVFIQIQGAEPSISFNELAGFLGVIGSFFRDKDVVPVCYHSVKIMPFLKFVDRLRFSHNRNGNSCGRCSAEDRYQEEEKEDLFYHAAVFAAGHIYVFSDFPQNAATKKFC